MNVCFCTHRLPYPPLAGGKRETYKLIEGLDAAGHTVDLVSYSDDPSLAAEMAESVDCTIHTVSGLPNRTPTNLARNLVSRDPLPVMKADRDKFRTTVSEQSKDADVVHLHALQTSFLARGNSVEAPTVIRFNNVKYDIYRQFARFTDNPAKAAYAYLQYYKTKSYERSIPTASNLSLTITPEDRERLLSDGATPNIDVLPAGVDPSEFDLLDHDPESPVITFFGSMDYHPNEDGVRWFAREVLPLIREQRPGVTFDVVGKDPSKEIRDLDSQESVNVTGFVEDLGVHVARAAVVVLPIRVGTGIRMKALHAMAMGKPLVSTSLGVQGIDGKDGTHFSIANDSPNAFATAVVDLLDSPDQQANYRQNARELIERDHDWNRIAQSLEGFYETVIADV
ncbi:glycosyltransferase [Halobacteriaceae archaeon SHR40]|uniref:glycosyltransferase n=1 Tax=Halovenus amylolytica TaxID=2500550 RepID=UPI000FE2F3F2